MPCRHDPSPEEIAAAEKLAKEKTVAPFKKKLAAMEKQRDELTRLLCTTCTYIESLGHRSFFSNQEDVDSWWAAHKIMDSKRKAREAAEMKPSKTLPLKLERIDDGEWFTLNENGNTYSSASIKKQFPKHKHQEHSLMSLVNSGGFRITL